MSRKHIFTLLLLITLLCGCRTGIPSSDDLDYPDDVSWEQPGNTISGLFYVDPCYYRTVDDINYVAVNITHHEQLVMTYDEIMNLKAGDELRIDRDRITTVEEIFVDNDWEPEQDRSIMTCELGDCIEKCNKGMIRINAEYYFSHPAYLWTNSGKMMTELSGEWIDSSDNECLDLWILHDHNPYLMSSHSYQSMVIRYDDLRWVEIPDNCRVIISDMDQSFNYETDYYGLQEALVRFRKSESVSRCYGMYDRAKGTIRITVDEIY